MGEDEDERKRRLKWLRGQFIRWDLATYWPYYLGALFFGVLTVLVLFGATGVPNDWQVPGAIAFGVLTAVMLLWVRAKRARGRLPGGGAIEGEKGADLAALVVLNEQERDAETSQPSHSHSHSHSEEQPRQD
jgi:hypothetical protein